MSKDKKGKDKQKQKNINAESDYMYNVYPKTIFFLILVKLISLNLCYTNIMWALLILYTLIFIAKHRML